MQINALSKLPIVMIQQSDVESLKTFVASDPALSFIRPQSIQSADECILFMVACGDDRSLVVMMDEACESGRLFNELEGIAVNVRNGIAAKICGLSVANSRVIMEFIPSARPISLRQFRTTMGLGDRLGLASPGHIRAVRGLDVKPVLAQQSIRELQLTGRTFEGVLSDAVWGVFSENYRGGFGADGDHLKTIDEVQTALDAGYTMITLDCSMHIRDTSGCSNDVVDRMYSEIDEKKRKHLERVFLTNAFRLPTGLPLKFTHDTLMRCAVTYQSAVDFAAQVFKQMIAPLDHEVDFELSIDETSMPTDPLAHFFVAHQLVEAGVDLFSVAPRFCGEFQKAIDYIGDIERFHREFCEHQQIAEHFGYKLSIHSGSDKFSVYPIIGEETDLRVHVKTSGTNWLEAVAVIIEADPRLYREMHAFALDYLPEARKYYAVTLDAERIPSLDELDDDELSSLIHQNDARQMMHIAYGGILQSKDERGNYAFRDRIYQCLRANEGRYCDRLVQHIGRHLETLGAGK